MAAPVNRAKSAILRRPPTDEIWLHIDRFDKKGRAVWALQYWDLGLKYRVAIRVRFSGGGGTVTRLDGLQPRAWLRFANCRVVKDWKSRHYVIEQVY